MKDYITDDDLEINVLYILNQYADENLEFRSKFLDGLDSYFQKEHKISHAQYETLKQMYFEIFKEEFVLDEIPQI